MDLIIEKNSFHGTTFEKYNNRNLIKQVCIIGLQKKSEDGFTYILLLNSSGKTIYEVYKFLNDHLRNVSYKQREQSLNALKLFFSFIELFDITDYKNLNEIELKKLITFLKGDSLKGNTLDIHLKTTRSSKTINQYMGVYRKYFKFLGINESIFHKSRIISQYRGDSYGFLGHGKMVTMQKYNSNQNVLDCYSQKRIPKYIKIDEYIRIMKLIKNKNSKYGLREEIIIKLMFEYGLRISEVLGITLEDIYNSNDKVGKIILRNRLSDNKYQSCKTLVKPKTIHSYNSTDYNTKNSGYHEIYVELGMIDLIKDYIDSTRDIFSMTQITLKNIEQSKADNVSFREDILDNYYVFISKNYTPLSGSGWNKIIREIFQAVGLQLDKGSKKNNLNHRFRHGYAMWLKKELELDRLELKELLRHRSIHSVETYYNPDVDDNIKTAIRASDYIKNVLNINKIIGPKLKMEEYDVHL